MEIRVPGNRVKIAAIALSWLLLSGAETQAAPDSLLPNFDSAIAIYKFPSPECFEILPNGLTVIIDEAPGVEYFRLALLGRPESLSGREDQSSLQQAITTVLNAQHQKQSADTLSGLGPEQKDSVNDGPAGQMDWVPAFVSTTAKPENGLDAISALHGLLANPEPDSLGRQLIERILAEQNSTATQSSPFATLLTALFSKTQQPRPVISVSTHRLMCTAEEFPDFQRRLFAPNNSILSIVCPNEAAVVLDRVRTTLGTMEAKEMDSSAITSRSPAGSGVQLMIDTEWAGPAQLLIGDLLPGAAAPEAVDLQLAAVILDERCSIGLQSRRNMSASCRAVFERQVGWYSIAGACPETGCTALLDALTLECEKLAFDGPTAEELTCARSRVWGERMLVKASPMDQCRQMALDVYLGLGLNYDRKLAAALKTATAASVREAAARYLRPDRWTIVNVGQHD